MLKIRQKIRRLAKKEQEKAELEILISGVALAAAHDQDLAIDIVMDIRDMKELEIETAIEIVIEKGIRIGIGKEKERDIAKEIAERGVRETPIQLMKPLWLTKYITAKLLECVILELLFRWRE